MKAAAKRKKIIDHFAVVTSDGISEPTLVHRWPPTDAHAPYELPPVRSHFYVINMAMLA